MDRELLGLLRSYKQAAFRTDYVAAATYKTILSQIIGTTNTFDSQIVERLWVCCPNTTTSPVMRRTALRRWRVRALLVARRSTRTPTVPVFGPDFAFSHVWHLV
ncbi:hypothetical protein FRC12_024901 [Ceratobasidium sp. 428]|nr:hypothetical protein FRC12_024901 [Ceratobasidium sp. 428]